MLPALVLAQAVGICSVVPDSPQCIPAKHDEAKHEEEEKPQEVTVRSKPPARSASDWQVDKDTLSSVPHETGADVLGALPGVFVSNRGLLGQAPHLSLRGFEGTSGQ